LTLERKYGKLIKTYLYISAVVVHVFIVILKVGHCPVINHVWWQLEWKSIRYPAQNATCSFGEKLEGINIGLFPILQGRWQKETIHTV